MTPSGLVPFLKRWVRGVQSGQGPEGSGLLAGFGAGAEVFVFEPVAVALETEDLGVVNEPVGHGRGDDLVPKIWPQAEKGLLEVTISALSPASAGRAPVQIGALEGARDPRASA
jgi:hypothetical protein